MACQISLISVHYYIRIKSKQKWHNENDSLSCGMSRHWNRSRECVELIEHSLNYNELNIIYEKYTY